MDSLKREQLTVKRQEGGLLVQGPSLSDEGGGAPEWSAVPIDDKRIMMMTDDVKPPNGQMPAGMASCPIRVFKDFFLGLNQSGWSGVIAADTGYGIKRVFFSHGDVVFAASNIIDDRLGEVIYREAKISLDELTSSAAQVTKARKFGQVLISSGIFSNVQLWQALKLQVVQILRSIFMVDQIYFELQVGAGLAPTEVIFQESVTQLISDCFAYGCSFRGFLGKLRADSMVEMTGAEARAAHEPGTFVGDLVALIEQQANVQELLNASKLIDTYTVAALFNLVNQGLCRITPEVDDGRRPPPGMAPLKAKFDAYSYVLQAVRKGFTDANLTFPAGDVRTFAVSLNPDGFPSLFLEPDASLGRECIAGLISQCSNLPERTHYYVLRVEGLIQFLLQVAGDNLTFPVAKQIRQDYRSVTP